MNQLHIARGLSLPIKAVTQTFTFLAMRGVGKTYAAYGRRSSAVNRRAA